MATAVFARPDILLFDEPLHLFGGSAVSPVRQEILNELVDLDGVLETD